jgi:hypothetical protein
MIHLASRAHDAIGDEDYATKSFVEPSRFAFWIFLFFTTLKSHKHQPIANVRREEVKEKGTRSQSSRPAVEERGVQAAL